MRKRQSYKCSNAGCSRCNLDDLIHTRGTITNKSSRCTHTCLLFTSPELLTGRRAGNTVKTPGLVPRSRAFTTQFTVFCRQFQPLSMPSSECGSKCSKIVVQNWSPETMHAFAEALGCVLVASVLPADCFVSALLFLSAS
jgi:hypothetical protein